MMRIMLGLALLLLTISALTYVMSFNIGPIYALLLYMLALLVIFHTSLYRAKSFTTKRFLKLLEYVVIATTVSGLFSVLEVHRQLIGLNIVAAQAKILKERSLITRQIQDPHLCDRELAQINTTCKEFQRRLIVIDLEDINQLQKFGDELQYSVPGIVASLSGEASLFYMEPYIKDLVDLTYYREHQYAGVSDNMKLIGCMMTIFGISLRVTRTTAEALEWHS